MRNKYVLPSPLCWVDDGGGLREQLQQAWLHRTDSYPHSLLLSPFMHLHSMYMRLLLVPEHHWPSLAWVLIITRAFFFSLPLFTLLVPPPPRSFQASPAPRVCKLPLLSSQSLDYLHFHLDLLLEAWIPRQGPVQGPCTKDMLNKALPIVQLDKLSKRRKWKFRLT